MGVFFMPRTTYLKRRIRKEKMHTKEGGILGVRIPYLRRNFYSENALASLPLIASFSFYGFPKTIFLPNNCWFQKLLDPEKILIYF